MEGMGSASARVCWRKGDEEKREPTNNHDRLDCVSEGELFIIRMPCLE